MQTQDVPLRYTVYASAAELPVPDAVLLRAARSATAHAYAPYSHFRVGAAARLATGETVTGSNQENASFPAGICAERTLLSTAASLYPGQSIEALAITYHNEAGPSATPITPCGICRQSLAEFQARTGRPIRLILGGEEGAVWVLEDAGALLPLAFGGGDLR